MKRLLYIGNKLNNSKSNITSIEILGKLFEDEGYEVYYASSINNIIFRLFDMIFSVIKYRNKIDYIIIDTYSTLNFYYALIISQLARLLSIPYLPILRGGNLPLLFGTKSKFCSLIFNNSYFNIAPSKYLKENFEDHGFTNLKYIPNTIVIENYPHSSKQYNSVNLLWVRSFSVIYNPLMAVKVLKRLQEKGYEAELCMVGPDSDGSLQNIQEFADAIAVDVRFTGKLSKQEWIELSKRYNIFINTTNVDNTPLSVIEAMALGLPVVSTNVGGMPYLIDNHVTGLLVEQDSVDGMVEAIEMLLDDPKKRDDILLNARKLAESFDWDVVKKSWNEILRNESSEF